MLPVGVVSACLEAATDAVGAIVRVMCQVLNLIVHAIALVNLFLEMVNPHEDAESSALTST